jgi:hypothetical protein
LKDIIACLKNITSIPNICGDIDGIHILLTNLPNKKVKLVIDDFSIGKKIHNIVLQVVCDVDKIFWNIYVG